MNHKRILISVAVLILLAALFFAFRHETPERPPATNTGGSSVAAPLRHRMGSSTERPSAFKEIALPGLPPRPYTNRREMTLAQIVGKFGTLEDVFPFHENHESLQRELGSSIDVFTDASDNIVALYRNRGLVPTESRLELAMSKFKEQGFDITRLGNETANLGNKVFVLGLLELLLSNGGIDVAEGSTEDYLLVPYHDLEIIPITVRATGMARRGIPESQELPAIIWKSKYINDGPKADYGDKWTEDFPYFESHLVDWTILLINPNPKDGDLRLVFDSAKYPGVCLGRFYERRVLRPGEPPFKPPPPLMDHP